MCHIENWAKGQDYNGIIMYIKVFWGVIILFVFALL